MAKMTEQKEKFCELYAYKEDLKLTHELIAVELDISVKTIQRWLKEPEVINLINKICASRLDRMIPTLTANTEALLNSKTANDKIKGMDSFWKLQEKMDRIQRGSEASREQELLQKLAVICIDNLKDVFDIEDIIEFTVKSVGNYVIKEGYKEKVSVNEIERFLQEHGQE